MDDALKLNLTPDQKHILCEGGTEPPFSGAYWNTHDPGMYLCAACGNELFSSETKFDSGTGWPSFWQPVDPAQVSTLPDASGGVSRTEVRCARCGGHLGHVFDDGPNPTGKRYCLNSAALKFKPKDH